MRDRQLSKDRGRQGIFRLAHVLHGLHLRKPQDSIGLHLKRVQEIRLRRAALLLWKLGSYCAGDSQNNH